MSRGGTRKGRAASASTRRGLLVRTLRREGQRAFDAPLVGPALAAIEAGERPTDRELRGALRELRAVRLAIVTRGAPGQNEHVLAELDDFIDVLRFAQRQPVELGLVACSACGIRERHFDDLCKRCADEAGVRPRGKV